MTHRVRTSKRAEADIETIWAWIAHHEAHPLNAARWMDGLEVALATLKEHPLRCPRAPEAAFLDRDVRQLLYHSHRVLFGVEREEVLVLHVRHGSRPPAPPEDIAG